MLVSLDALRHLLPAQTEHIVLAGARQMRHLICDTDSGHSEREGGPVRSSTVLANVDQQTQTTLHIQIVFGEH